MTLVNFFDPIPLVPFPHTFKGLKLVLTSRMLHKNPLIDTYAYERLYLYTGMRDYNVPDDADGIAVVEATEGNNPFFREFKSLSRWAEDFGLEIVGHGATRCKRSRLFTSEMHYYIVHFKIKNIDLYIPKPKQDTKTGYKGWVY